MGFDIIEINLVVPSCYSCADCNKGLEAGQGCDAPNREVYCKACYGNLFGLHGYGFGGFGSLPALTAGGGEVKTEYHYTQFFWTQDSVKDDMI